MLIKVAVVKRADGGRAAGGDRRGGRGHPATRSTVHRHEIIGRVGVNVVAVPEHAALGLPGVRTRRVKQEVLVVVEGIIGVAHEQHAVLGQVVGARGGVGLGQHAHGVAIYVQVVGVEQGAEAQAAQYCFVELVDAAFGHAHLVPVAAGQHRMRGVGAGGRRATGGYSAGGGRVAVIERNQAFGLAGLGVAAHGAQAQVRHRLLHLGARRELRVRPGRQLAHVE